MQRERKEILSIYTRARTRKVLLFEARIMLFEIRLEMILFLSFTLVHLSAPSPREKMIRGGEVINIETMPHSVVIIVPNIWPTELEICFGSILNHRWVLTAAHCVSDKSPRGTYIKIRFGIDSYSQLGPVSDVGKAVCYNRHYYMRIAAHDICLLQTFDEIPFSEKVQPLALPFPNETLESVSMVRVAGWGLKSFFHPSGDFVTTRLRALNIPIIGMPECSKHVGIDFTVEEPGMVFCAGDKEEKAGTGCPGDSGSASVVRRSDNSTWVGIGVLQGGNVCGGLSLFPSIPYHTKWIKKLKQYS